jgi:hypothetical protein
VSEIQAFTQTGTDQAEVQRAILEEVAARGLEGQLRQVFVFELEAESQFGDREMLERAAELAEQDARRKGLASITLPPDEPDTGLEPRRTMAAGTGQRPPLLRVVLSSSTWRSEAEVSLGKGSDEVVGSAEGEKTPHGLRVLAQATLEAANKLVEGEFVLRGASLVTAFEEEIVLVLVHVDNAYTTVGAALTRGGPVSEATVRATLDALNRRLVGG